MKNDTKQTKPDTLAGEKLHMLNAAAAKDRERLDLAKEEAKLPPVLVLGYRGEACVYYSRTYKREFTRTAGEHDKKRLRALAPRDELVKWLFPDRGENDTPEDGELFDTMGARLLDASGRAGTCSYDSLRGAGCWMTAEGIVYNAGNACFLCAPDGTIRPCSNIRQRGGNVTIYAERKPLPHPAAEALTDEEGQALLTLCQARAWVHDWHADILAGWMVSAILGEAMPFRPHVWINAPSNAGKTELKNVICRVLGPLPAVLESAKSTEAACRGMLDNGARPVIIDEADAPGDDCNQSRNLSALMELARSATCGGVISKGTPDGGTKEYLMASPFLFFSIRNILSREEDLNRFGILEMKKLPPGKSLNALCDRWNKALAIVTAPGYTGKLFTRVLQQAARLRSLADKLAEHIRAQDVTARTAQYAACVMAGAWILTHSEEMPETYRARAVDLAKALAEAVQEDDESQRALLHLLGYRPTGARTVEQLARAAALGSPEEKKRAAEELAACKMEVAGRFLGAGAEKEGCYLKVLNASPTLQTAFEKTQWAVGRGTVGKTLQGVPGVIYKKAKLWGRSARVILIPYRYWSGEE